MQEVMNFFFGGILGYIVGFFALGVSIVCFIIWIVGRVFFSQKNG